MPISKNRSFTLLLTILLSANTYVLAQNYKQQSLEHIRLAEQYHNSGKYNQAKTELGAALKLDPQNPEILNSLGAIYLSLSESSADKEQQISNLVEARRYFTSALDINPDYAAAWNGMAGVYYLSNESTKAISCYKKALGLAPKRAFEVYTNLANTLRDGGQMTEAEENYKNAIELNPLYAPGHNGYAELLYNEQRYAEALPEAVEAIRLKPDYSTAYYHLGLIECADDKKDDALKAYILSLRYEKNPRYAQDTRSLIGQLGLDVKTVSSPDLDRFQNSLCRPLSTALVVKKDKTAMVAMNNPAQKDQVATKESEHTSSEKSVPVQPNGVGSEEQIKQIRSLMDNREWEKAIDQLSALLKKYPDDAVILNELGVVYVNQKKYTAAAKLFKKAITSSHGQLGPAYYNLGQTYLCNHDYVKAQEYLEKAKKLDKDDPGNRALINNSLGMVLKHKGDLSAAQAAYEAAIADGGNLHPVFHYNLAILLERMNKPKEAAKEFNLYLQLAPNGINAKTAQDRLKRII